MILFDYSLLKHNFVCVCVLLLLFLLTCLHSLQPAVCGHCDVTSCFVAWQLYKWCDVCLASEQIQPDPVQTLNPLTVTYLLPSPFFKIFSPPFLLPVCLPPPFLLPTPCPPLLSSPSFFFFTLPLFPTAVSTAGAVDSVVVPALRLNLGLLGGAGSPVALEGRHSVPAHYRHNLLLSPVSKKNKIKHWETPQK